MTLFETIKYFFIKKYFSVELLSEYLLSIEKNHIFGEKLSKNSSRLCLSLKTSFIKEGLKLYS